MTKEKGLVSIWILGMMNSGPETVVIVPYKPGDEATLGHVVKSDYFGVVPPERLKITPEAVLFRADGECRSKIGVPQKRAKNVARLDRFKNNVLTLVNFNMPPDPTQAILHEQRLGRTAERAVRGRRGQQLQRRPARAGKKGMGAIPTNSNRFPPPRNLRPANPSRMQMLPFISRPTGISSPSRPRKFSASIWKKFCKEMLIL